MKKRIYYILFVTLSLSVACKTRKGKPSGPISNVPTVSDDNYNKENERFWYLADSASNRFTFLNARFNATLKNPDGKEQSVKGKFKAAKDSVIWASITPLGLEVARIRADKNSFGFIDYFNKKYFLGDYSLLKDFAGYDMDFYALQALLLGIHEFNEGKLELSPAKSDENWMVLQKGLLRGESRVPDKKVWFSKDYIIPYRFEYSDWKTGEKVSSGFSGFQLYGKVIFASKINVEIKTEKKRFLADLEFKSIDFDDPETEFYFTIPDSYEQITLTK